MKKYLSLQELINVKIKLLLVSLFFFNSFKCYSQINDTIFTLVEKSVKLRVNPLIYLNLDDSLIQVKSSYFGRDSIFNVYIFVIAKDTKQSVNDSFLNNNDFRYWLVIKCLFRNHFFGFNENIWQCILKNEGWFNIRKEKLWKYRYPISLSFLCEHLARLPQKRNR